MLECEQRTVIFVTINIIFLSQWTIKKTSWIGGWVLIDGRSWSSGFICHTLDQCLNISKLSIFVIHCFIKHFGPHCILKNVIKLWYNWSSKLSCDIVQSNNINLRSCVKGLGLEDYQETTLSLPEKPPSIDCEDHIEDTKGHRRKTHWGHWGHLSLKYYNYIVVSFE